MNEKQAMKYAHDFLAAQIKLEYSPEGPTVDYTIRDQEEYFFTFHLFDAPSVSSSKYIAVSKQTGQVRCVGFQG